MHKKNYKRLVLCFMLFFPIIIFSSSCKKEKEALPPFELGKIQIDQKNYWHSLTNPPARIDFKNDGWIRFIDSTSVLNAQAKMGTFLAKSYMSKEFTVSIDLRFISLCNSANLDVLTLPANDGFGESNDTNDGNIHESGFSMAVVLPNYPKRIIFAIMKAQDYNTSQDLEIWKVVDSGKRNFYIFQRIYSGKDIKMDGINRIKFSIAYNDGKEWKGKIYVNDKFILENSFGMSNTYGGLGSLTIQCKGTTPRPVCFEVRNIDVENKMPF